MQLFQIPFIVHCITKYKYVNILEISGTADKIMRTVQKRVSCVQGSLAFPETQSRGAIMKTGTKWLLKVLSVTMVSLIMLALPAASMNALAAGATDNSRPTSPASLAASSISQTSLKLTWKKSTDNVGVTSYAVYKNAAYLTHCATTSCQITGLSPGTTYTFYVAAQDKSGNISAASNKITVKTLSASPSKKIIAGYYASWAAYSGYTPADIPAANLTHIIYAFANIDKSYKITMGDTDVDPGNLKELQALKKNYPALKTIISVGGWEWSGRFSDMASTASRRTAFANSVAAFLKKYGLDGVDLDWEYPVGGGLAANSVRAADKTNFTLLLKALRTKLNAQGKADGKHYLLTIAGGADTNYVGHVQLKSIAQYLDFATVMTYDIHGAFDKYTDLNAPLYPTTGKSPQTVWSADQAVKAWTAAGFPRTKLVLGVPFYGHMYTGVKGGGSGLFKTYSSMKTVSYDQIVSTYLSSKSYKRTYATQGKTPYLFNGSTFISYEDPQSLATKAAYINSKGLAGAGIWELSENTNGSLLKTLRTKLK
jgi:chitinase